MSEIFTEGKSHKLVKIFLVVLFLFLLVLLLIVILLNKKEQNIDSLEGYPLSKIISKGGEGVEKYSCEHNEDEIILVSNFETSNYHCTGSCMCIVEKERRSTRSSVLFSRSIVFFLTAISSLSAFNLAKNQFQESCETDLIETCWHAEIVGEVEDCQAVEPDEKKNLIDSNDEGLEKYECEGSCLPNKEFLAEKRVKYPSKYFEMLKYLGQKCSENSELKVEVIVKKEEDPEDIFVKDYLSPTCERINKDVQVKFIEVFGSEEDDKGFGNRICVALPLAKGPTNFNQSVKCKGIVKKLDPCRLTHYKKLVP